MSLSERAIFPISELSPFHSRWTIRARVTTKSTLREFNRGNNAGKVFSVELLDASGGEIRASFFNQAVDQYFGVLQIGKCYVFSRGGVKVANRQYNACKHRYELTFDRDSEVIEVAEDISIETVKFHFENLKSVHSMTVPCNVDLCGIVAGFRSIIPFTSRDGRELVKRDITLADDSGVSMDVTLWGERAKQDDRMFEGNPLIALKGVVVKEWNGGRNGSLLEGGTLVFKPSSPEAARVQQWWSEGGATQGLTQLSVVGGGGNMRHQNARHLTLVDVRQASEKVMDQPEIYSSVCRLALVQTRKQGDVQPLHYMACQEPKEGMSMPCNRRVDESGYCATCGRVGKAAPRLNVRCRFVDFEDGLWLTTFHEAAQQVFGMSADEICSMEKNASSMGDDGREEIDAMLKGKYFLQPVQVVMRAKLDTYQGEPRTNITCIGAAPVNIPEHGMKMLKEIHEMLGGAVV